MNLYDSRNTNGCIFITSNNTLFIFETSLLSLSLFGISNSENQHINRIWAWAWNCSWYLYEIDLLFPYLIYAIKLPRSRERKQLCSKRRQVIYLDVRLERCYHTCYHNSATITEARSKCEKKLSQFSVNRASFFDPRWQSCDSASCTLLSHTSIEYECPTGANKS